MKYICELCNYQTHTASNWCSHKNSKKHQLLANLSNDIKKNPNNNDNNDKIDNNLLLEKLKNAENEKTLIINKYETINEMQQNVIIKLEDQVDILKEEIKKLNNEIIILNQENKNILKDNNIKLEKEYKNEREYNKQIVTNAGNLVGKSITALQYISKNYNSAPQLCQLDDYSNIGKNEQTLIEELIYYYKKSILHEYIGNYIIKNYKKDNPEHQSLWNTDCERLNYIIRELMTTNNNTIIIEELDDNNKLTWSIDKKGTKVSNQIITPLLDYIKKICTLYIQNNNDLTKISQKKSEIVFKKLSVLNDIIGDINNGIILKNIQKYISPKFYLNKTLILK